MKANFNLTEERIKNLWWQNTLLLGFNLDEYTRKYPGLSLNKVAFGQEMFCVGNEKGLLVLLQFLLGQLDPSFHQEIVGSWPFYDTASQRQFKRLVHRRLEALSNAGLIPPSAARGTTLQSAKGEGAIEVVAHLAHEVLRQKLVSDFGPRTAFVPNMQLLASASRDLPRTPKQDSVAQIKRATKALCVREHRMLKEAFLSAAEDEAGWLDFVQELDKQGKEFKKTQEEIRRRTHQELQREDQRIFSPVAVEERTRSLQKIRETWRRMKLVSATTADILQGQAGGNLPNNSQLLPRSGSGTEADITELATGFLMAMNKLSRKLQELQQVTTLDDENHEGQSGSARNMVLTPTEEETQLRAQHALELGATTASLMALQGRVQETLTAARARVSALEVQCHHLITGSLLNQPALVTDSRDKLKPCPPTPSSKKLSSNVFLKTPAALANQCAGARNKTPAAGSKLATYHLRVQSHSKIHLPLNPSPTPLPIGIGITELSESVRKIWKTPFSKKYQENKDSCVSLSAVNNDSLNSNALEPKKLF